MPASKKKNRILISGFAPFDGDEINLSAEFLKWIKTQEVPAIIHCELLPVSFTHAYPQLEAAIKSFAPTHVLLTGLAKNRSELTIERAALNWIDARIPDNDGLRPERQKIMEGSEDGLFSTLSVELLLEAGNKVGCSTKLSTSAGEYVCNHLMYLYLFNHRSVPGTFIHVPGQMDPEISFRGLLSIITELSESGA